MTGMGGSLRKVEVMQHNPFLNSRVDENGILEIFLAPVFHEKFVILMVVLRITIVTVQIFVNYKGDKVRFMLRCSRAI